MAQGRKTLSSQDAYREALLMLAPGTRIREAISAILQAGTGALLCFGDTKRLSRLSEGGVELNAPMMPQLLYELSKMDGGIILSEDGSRILYANRFLKPAAKFPSDETGTRHRVAQRLAAQAKCVVVAVSQRRSSVTLYVHDQRHVLDDISTLVKKAEQALQTLEKYAMVLGQSMQNLTTRELQDVVTIFDVCRAIQRTEMVRRIGEEMEPYILELGTEGRLIDLQRQELLLPLSEAGLTVKDYYRERPGVTIEDIETQMRQVSEHDLWTLGSISQVLGYGTNLRSIDTYLSPRGYRVLASTQRIQRPIITNLIQRFGNLQKIIRAPKDELCEVEGVGDVLAERIRVSIDLLRNQLTLADRR